ncbi:MAG: LTA synthase family protein [Clostridia bacterium]|nr:LTA synthase family protein [Clostridia bacterium]
MNNSFESTLPAKKENFFTKNFTITSSKPLKITGFSIAAIFLAIVIIFNNQFISLPTKARWWLLAAALVLPIIIGLYTAYNIKIKNNKFNKIWHFAFFFFMPLITMLMTECLNNVFIYNMTYLGFFANYVIILLFQFFFFAVSGSFRVAFLVVNAICYGLALANCYVVMFRGSPFVLWDVLSITTAANVANTYNFTPTHIIMTGTMIFVFIVIIGAKTNTPKYNFATRIFSRTFMGSFFSSAMILFYLTNIFPDAGVRPDFWNPTRGYRNYGFMFSFFCGTRYLGVSEPHNYNASAVPDYVENTIGEQANTGIVKPTGNEPNIICIMNESLSDLSVLGQFQTNEDYMPFMRSLTENTVKGNLYVPVIGAGTANTEFEFLSGYTTAFLPAGSNAYMLYIKDQFPSLVSTLEAQGYSSWAFHPYYASGWNRVKVYDHMGFNSHMFLENLIDSSILKEYNKNNGDAEYLQNIVDEYYPDRDNMLIRQYVSDSYNYDILIEDFENRDKSKPYFAFNVTMQNHGGYVESASNFEEDIYIEGTTEYYNKANKYLSLVKKSDDAFKELIEYFEDVDEPTVICMFGDHQPSIETEFIASLLGEENLGDLSIEQDQARHVTPFFIWANYDIEEKYIEKLSVNYLSSYVLDVADVQLTAFNKYLLKLSETLPVIDTVGYIDSNNTYYSWNDNSIHSTALNQYEQIQYNIMFDKKEKHTEIFLFEGYTIE